MDHTVLFLCIFYNFLLKTGHFDQYNVLTLKIRLLPLLGVYFNYLLWSVTVGIVIFLDYFLSSLFCLQSLCSFSLCSASMLARISLNVPSTKRGGGEERKGVEGRRGESSSLGLCRLFLCESAPSILSHTIYNAPLSLHSLLALSLKFSQR